MNLLRIARKNILYKPLNTALSLILLAFGVGIISLLLLLENGLKTEFDRNIRDIDMVLGAKGSPLQLILANIYHLDAPTGNISRQEARRVMKHPYIDKAIPLAYGDNYRSFRIVGTTHDYPEHYEVALLSGRLWETPFEATIGSKVAQSSGLKLGDTFYSAHGLEDETDVHENNAFTVVGIFAESGSVIDQLILTPMESIWNVHAHPEDAAADSTSLPEDAPEDEITAVLLTKKNPLAIVTIPNLIRDTNMQVALPAIEINRLTQNFGIGMKTLSGIAVLIMIISFISVFISLYNSMKERKYELALMRSMGASRSTLFLLILTEGLWLTVLGTLLGLVMSRVGMWVLSSVMKDEFKYDIGNMGVLQGEIILIGLTIFVGVLASLLPARETVRMDVSKILGDA
ncbi:MAG: hypothetical protein RL226_2122 [Bacteroidota bacterium]|jgi:putative ABC transport system permease protein